MWANGVIPVSLFCIVNLKNSSALEWQLKPMNKIKCVLVFVF